MIQRWESLRWRQIQFFYCLNLRPSLINENFGKFLDPDRERLLYRPNS